MRGRMRIWIWVVVIVCLALPVATIWQARSAQVLLKDSTLLVGGGAYRVEVPYESLRLEEVVIGQAPETRLSVRTNGIAWPGFGLGWFRTGAGEKVFGLVSRGQSLYIPTGLDYGLVISREDPQGFLDQLRQRRSAQ